MSEITTSLSISNSYNIYDNRGVGKAEKVKKKNIRDLLVAVAKPLFKFSPSCLAQWEREPWLSLHIIFELISGLVLCRTNKHIHTIHPKCTLHPLCSSPLCPACVSELSPAPGWAATQNCRSSWEPNNVERRTWGCNWVDMFFIESPPYILGIVLGLGLPATAQKRPGQSKILRK